MYISVEDNKYFVNFAVNEKFVWASGNRSNLRNQIATKMNKPDTCI